MSDDIVFIKDINDYNEYNKLKPKIKYIYKKVKFICSNCKKEKIQTFRNLTTSLICKSCNCSIAQKSDLVKEKKKQTCLKKYGVEYISQSKIIKEKTKQTNLKKFGVEYSLQSNTVKEKGIKTCLEKYGVKNPSQSNIIKNKKKNTALKNFGVENPNKSKIIRNKIKNTCIKKYGVEVSIQNEQVLNKRKENNFQKYGKVSYTQTPEFKEKLKNIWNKKLLERLKNYNLTLLYKNKDIVKLLCNECNHEFEISRTGFFMLLNYYSSNFCPNCKRIIFHGKSQGEKELLNYIKTLYNNEILENVRTIISPKELDIYLPDLKLAFEYDGTYWHADPRFYKETDIIELKNITAGEIWKKDIEKNLLCENNGIKLIRIKEFDWINNQDKIKEYIKTLFI